MPSVDQLRTRLLKKLEELFQLDQPDLDFGFYRIMHAKADQIKDFLDKDLLKIIEEAFGDADETRKAELKAKIEQEIAAAKEYGVAEPENSPKVVEAQAAYVAASDSASAEADVYDHLYRFFERYYDDGDFISRRYYTRETSGKAAPFAVPYNGEEVKLHWANADQYYIKSAEYFSNYTIDLTQTAEVRKMSAEERVLQGIPDTPLKVHFRVVEASEGEHGNVKASDANKRFFILHAENPVALTESGELVVHFEYRPDPEKTGQENTWRDKRNAESVETILKTLEEYDPQIAQMDADEKKPKEICENPRKSADEYLRLFKVPAPTDSDKKRPVLAKYVNQYTARNTMDYFIHKDLGGFLRRELDFYIKNEVMRLDDIENAEVPAVESYLAKIKVLRKIAGKLIDFLAQLEDFQKKLWLKKKFVVETNYCITLDRMPEELYPLIVDNHEQIQEWVKLGFIEENDPQITQKDADLFGSNLRESAPSADNMSVEVLKVNNKLVLDTRFFDESFKARLVASIENFDEQCDGLLIHSENFQALNLLHKQEQFDYVFIDPPYNTGVDGFIYKDSYQHSTWMTFILDRIVRCATLMRPTSIFSATIDYVEVSRLRLLLDEIFGSQNFLADIAWEKRYTRSNNAKCFYSLKDTVLCYRSSIMLDTVKEPRTEKSKTNYLNPDEDPRGPWISSSYVNPATKEQRPNLVYPIKKSNTGVEVNHPTHAWKYDRNTCQEHEKAKRLYWGQSGEYEYPRLKSFLSEAKEGIVPVDFWNHKDSGTTDEGGTVVKSLFGSAVFDNPKPPKLIQRIISLMRSKEPVNTGRVIDFFAGSGSTGQAVIDLNREDLGSRKYTLVEMGDYFDTVLKPRIAKVVYSEGWKDGKPTARHTGISHCFKYTRLESYEDTLNNLRLDHNPQRKKAVAANQALKEDYMLRYLLDVETRGSQSLLNIDAFADPTGYTLEVKKPGTDEYATRAVDLIETFNYLIGLRVLHTSVPQTFQATFKRITDPELPEDQHTKLVVDGRIKQDEDGPWWFRKVEGWVPKDAANPNNDQQEKVLVVWRKLTDDIEQDNLMLDEWFQKNRISTRDFEFDTIYVNGSNNLPNLKLDDENWKVRLIEEEFHKRMWEVER